MNRTFAFGGALAIGLMAGIEDAAAAGMTVPDASQPVTSAEAALADYVVVTRPPQDGDGKPGITITPYEQFAAENGIVPVRVDKLDGDDYERFLPTPSPPTLNESAYQPGDTVMLRRTGHDQGWEYQRTTTYEKRSTGGFGRTANSVARMNNCGVSCGFYQTRPR